MKKIYVLIIVPILLSGVLAYAWMQSGKPAHTESESTCEIESDHGHEHEEEASPALDLKIEPAVAGESWEQVAATGKVGPNANKVVKVGPRIDGKIVRVYADVGDVVRQGQALATLSSVELAQARAEYRQAAAKTRAAKDAYERQVKLARLGAFSKRPVEEAKSEHTSAQGELAQARSELAESRSSLARAESEMAQCKARLERTRELYKDQIVSRQDLESAEAEYKRDSADVDAAKARISQSEAKIRQAEARVGIAKSYLDREEKVMSGNLLSSRELQAAKAEVTAAELEVRAAADHIRVLGASPGGSGDTIAITAPISGRVVARSVNLGEMADPSVTLFTIMNLSDVWVEADVYEKDLAKVRKVQVAEIRVKGYPDKVFTGKVTYISDVLAPESRTAKVRCSVTNPTGLLKPEMFADVNIVTAKRGGAVLIPKEAVLDDAGEKVVFVTCTDCEEDVEAGRSVCGEYDKRVVKLGPVHNGQVEVLNGVELGEEVVTEGAFQLKTALGSGELEAGCSH